MENNKLEVGDVVYRYSYGQIANKHTIERVTKTWAISGRIKLKRNYSDGYINLVNTPTFGDVSYYIETEKNKKEWKKKLMIDYIEASDLHEFSFEIIEKVADLIKI